MPGSVHSVVLSLAIAAASGLAGHARADDALLRDHPLVDTIIATDTGAALDRDALVERLAAADLVLLGEKHDNQRHHALQAALVEALGARRTLDVVAFEMLTAERQTHADALGRGALDLAGFAEAVDWPGSGWPSWAWYEPVFAAAVDADAAIVAANLSGAQIEQIYQAGLSSQDAAWLARTGLDVPLDAGLHDALVAEIIDAHCGHDLGERAEAMVAIQRARDAALASHLSDARDDGIGVLVAGNGHVRRDRGVPAYLETLAPGADVVSLGLVEVSQDWQQVPDFGAVYDYVWLTARARPETYDYCADMAAFAVDERS
ncbi:MAG: ChaN family lipoprotein [Geminicoccaceae bacterium]